MKPVKLIMEAFGPYAEKTEIEFDKLGNGLYIITGDTGAGKTMIFDAITYALYGESSGGTRNGEMLRSGYVEETAKGYVELLFTHCGESYKVVRTLPHKRPRGEGLVSSTILLENDSKSIVLTKLGEANSKLREIVGLDADQFVQVAMIAQGEFKKVLYSQTKERGEIFRKIFATYKYMNMQESLKSRSSELKKECDKYNDNIRNLSDNIKGEMEHNTDGDRDKFMDELAQLIKADADLVSDLSKQLDERKEALEEIGLEIERGNKSNSEIDDLKNKQEELKDLESRKPEIEESEKRVRLSENARLYILPGEEKMNLAAAEYKQLQKELAKVEIEIEDTEKKSEVAVAELEMHKGEEEYRKQLVDEISRITHVLPDYKVLDESGKKASDIKKQLDEAEMKLQKAVKSSKDNENTLSLLRADYRQLEGVQTKEAELRAECSVLEGKHNDAKALVKSVEEIEKLKKVSKNAEAYFEECAKNKQLFNKIASDKEIAFYREQAGIMASTLEEGSECPVCGSTNHPKLAPLSEEAPSEEELNRAKEKSHKADEALTNAKSAAVAAKEQLDAGEKSAKEIALRIGIGGLENAKETEAEISKTLENKKCEYEKCKADCSRVKTLEELISKHERTTADLQIEIKEITETITELKAIYAGEVSRYEAIKKNLEYADMKSAQARIDSAQAELSKSSALLEEAQKRHADIKTKLAELCAIRDTTRPRLSVSEKKYEEAKLDFNRLCSEYGFEDVQEYKAACLSVSENERLHKTINDYKNQLVQTKALADEMERKLGKKEMVDVAALEERREGINEEVHSLESVIKDREYNLKTNMETEKKLSKCFKDYGTILEEYRTIKLLSDTANGNLYQKERIAFEQYIQTAKFDRVLMAANRRLAVMSQRYKLRRRDKAKNLQSLSGLDLDIEDRYTGKIRDVKTLSGGESFMASMALALGLSDTIEAESGGIKVDSVFVDEGFGTLDEEALKKALEVLMNLSEGRRSVGIISHVKELCEGIEKRILVTGSDRGSKAQMIIE